MRGSIQKRGPNKWRLVYDLTTDGRRRQRVVTFVGNKRAAEAKLSDLVAQARDGFRGSLQTLEAFLDSWLDSRHLAPTTLEGRRAYVRLYLRPAFGTLRLEELTPIHIQRLLAHLLRVGGPRGKPLSPLVVRNVHAFLKCALEDARRMGLIAFNPADRVRAPAGRAKPVTPLSRTQARALLLKLRDTPFGLLCFLGSVTGLRRGELLGLESSDFDLCHAVLAVRRSVDRLGNVRELGGRKLKPRSIPLPAEAIPAIQQILERAPAGRIFNFSPAGLSREFGVACRRAGFPGVHLHTLRHTVASLLLEDGVHPKAVQELLGHYDVRFTMSQYSHLMPGAFARSTETLGELSRDQFVTQTEKNRSKRLG